MIDVSLIIIGITDTERPYMSKILLFESVESKPIVDKELSP